MTADHNSLPRALSLAVHELRTPITVVAGYIRMLLREQGGPLTDKQRKMLEEAERSCARLGGLVGEMSELGKLDGHEVALAKQEIDLPVLIDELAPGMHEGEDRGVHLDVRRTEGSLVITGDRHRLSIAIKALIHSALRERGEPGAVVVETSVVQGETTWAVVAIGDASVLPSLAQAAIGGPPAFDEWRGGMGLALPVARRVIEAHGGALWSASDGQARAASALRLPLRS